MSEKNPVRTLNPEVARKIAAGEVIDRPNAIIRELMDNSIDSGATQITVEICGGGIEKIRIVDNGCGMTKEDLQNCAKPHATSKISNEVDLMNLSTLGLLGEALASIAAVSRLSIISGGWKMRASITEDHLLDVVAPTKGTIVQSEGLFENFPARRQFLKRPSTEGMMCKNTFVEKAMARPDIAFRFIQDGVTKLDLPGNQTLKERFVSANNYRESSTLFYQFGASSDENSTNPDWKFQVVIGEPSVARSNKKDIFIYANGRRIQEYSLVQAVEYGGQGYFPNGTFPVATLFVEVRPDLIDFNIHPAKKEARFIDISGLHHGVSSTIKNFFLQYTRINFENNKTTDEVSINELDFSPSDSAFETPASSNIEPSNIASIAEEEKLTGLDSIGSFTHGTAHINYKEEITPKDTSDYRSRFLSGNYSNKSSSSSGRENSYKGFPSGAMAKMPNTTPTEFKETPFISPTSPAREATASLAEAALKAQGNGFAAPKKIKYIGSCLGTFLLAEKDNCLYIIDQHAAHERILFDKLMASQCKAKSQKLLIPYSIKIESKTQDNLMEKLSSELERIGFEVKRKNDDEWEVLTIPERWTGTEYELRNLLFVKQVEPKEIIRSIAAMTSCKAAIKDGYIIDSITATELIEEAFKLPDPHCPHGRPIYTVISRAKLFELVKRT